MNERIYELIVAQLQSAFEVSISEAPKDYKIGFYECTIEHIMNDMELLKK